jgi:putative ABC transport system permease protein
MRRLHSLVGFAGALGLARGRRDAALLLTTIAVLALSVFLAVALPRLVTGAVDRGAQEAVAEAGTEADIEIRVDVGTPRPQISLVPPETVAALAEQIPARLSPQLARLYPELTLTILSPTSTAKAAGATAVPRLSLQLGLLANADAVSLRQGRLPATAAGGDRGQVVEVVLSAETAAAASVAVGDELEFPDANADSVRALVVGIVEPVDERAPQWDDMATVWAPVRGGSGAVAVTVLTDLGGLAIGEPLFANPMVGTLRLHAQPTAFSFDDLAPVRAQVSALRVDGTPLAGESGADLVIRSGFDTALDPYPARARDAVAQMLVLTTGVLAVASAVVMLLSRLLVTRRASELALERARGASLASIVLRSLLDSALVTAIAAAIGIGAVTLLWGAAPLSGPAIVAVAAVGVLTAPVLSAALVVSADRSRRRTAANRGDRRELQRRGQLRRLVLEAFVLLVAGAALFAARSRGLLQTRTDGVDPLLVAAPLLAAIAITVIVLRVYPLVVRLAMRIARRQNGALGTLGAMQAERALSVLPLAALTLAISLVVIGGLLVDTVRSGQVDASWQRTGADARVVGPLGDSDVAAARTAPGVTAATGLLTVNESRVAVGPESALVTIVAVDPSYGTLLSQLREQSGMAVDDDLSALFGPVAEGAPVPILIDPSLARKLSDDVKLTIAGETRETIEAEVVGTFDSGAGAYARGPFIYIDREALLAQIDFTVDTNLLLVMGPGAEAATHDLGGAVFDRQQWLVERQTQALVSGVTVVMLASTGAVALLAFIGLLANVLASSAARRRSLSLLRTLGVSSRMGWWLALSELAPTVIAALIGGVVAGVAVILVLGATFGLETLAGGVDAPALSIAPWVIAAVAVGAVALALGSMLVEVVAHRRDRLSDVLRVGETV